MSGLRSLAPADDSLEEGSDLEAPPRQPRGMLDPSEAPDVQP